MTEHQYKTGLAPVIGPGAEVLILGTLPGDVSLAAGRYYANARNQFWVIVSAVFGTRVPAEYTERVNYLLARRLALWDVCHSAIRPGSLDSAIVEPVPNDVLALLRQFPSIRRIGLNGGKAKSLFYRHFSGQHVDLVVCPLPSSSATPGRNVLNLAEKIPRWREVLLP